MQALLFSPHSDETNVFKVILQQAGLLVRSAQSLDKAIETWPENPAELVFIALSGVPEEDLKHIKQMRAYTAVPILVVADSLTEDLKVDFLEAGVDLLVLRPYGVRYLLAQIRTLLRRSGGVPSFSLPTLSQRDVSLNPADRTVKVGEREPKRLTQLEFRLLYTLMTHVGQIIPAEQIVEHVWGYSGVGSRELVRGLVQRLRTKVEETPGDPQYILTDVGIGYYFKG